MKHDRQTIDLAVSALRESWGQEWIDFTRSSAAVLPALVIHDFIDSNLSATEYRNNIYAGNLASYARCLTNKGVSNA